MKRITAACLEQTIHFQLKEDIGHAVAVRGVEDELAHYKQQLERCHTKFKLVSEERQPDDSIIIKIKKQYNDYKCGDYLN